MNTCEKIPAEIKSYKKRMNVNKLWSNKGKVLKKRINTYK